MNIERAALVIIDMQRDFLLPGGFGAALGNDVSRLNAAVGPCREVLAAARKAGLLVIHTREGHRPDLSDAPPVKVERGDPALRIGAAGPMGRILVRGEPGHDIIPELYPQAGEPVIDKPGKGTSPPTSADGIEKYLSSGMIRGVGPVYAKKLVRAFGEKVFDVIEATPDRLREVDGIGPVRAASILAARRHRAFRQFECTRLASCSVLVLCGRRQSKYHRKSYCSMQSTARSAGPTKAPRGDSWATTASSNPKPNSMS